MPPEKQKLIIYGIGKLAEYAHFVFTNDSEYEVICFCVENKFINPSKPLLFGLPIHNSEELETHFSPDEYKIFVAVGNNSVRTRIYTDFYQKNYSFASYVSSKCVYWFDCKIGNNVLISEGCTIQPFVSIGNNTFIFISSIGHHTTLADNVTLSVCSLGGGVIIESNTFVGLNASVNHNVKVGRNNIIGAGSNIIKNTKDDEVYTPAKSRLRLFPSSKIFSNFLK